uniref:Uncharacterized protein n=1 Tax=Arundo donax TaxID=35708 RepID=A0A0A8YQI1_ARUDO
MWGEEGEQRPEDPASPPPLYYQQHPRSITLGS